MNESQVDGVMSAVVEANAKVLGLEIRPEWHESVVANLKTIAAAAASVQACPLDDELEAAPVFSA